jgi:FtsZ-interacting cell division protein ZipA
MSTALIIVIAVVAAALIAYGVWRAIEDRRARRAVLEQRAAGHRQEADAAIASARDLGTEAEAHRIEAQQHGELAERHQEEAERHAAEAHEAEQATARKGRMAARHDRQAADLEEEV